MAAGDVERSAIEAVVRAAGGTGCISVRRVPSLSGSTVVDVRTLDGERLVVRFSSNAAAVAREQLICERVRGVLPVPEILWADPSGTATDRPTLVSRWIEGQSLDMVVSAGSDTDAAELGHAVGQMLSQLAAVQLAAPGWLVGMTLDIEPRDRRLSDGVRGHLYQRLFDTEGGHELDPWVRQQFWHMVNSRVDQLGMLEDDRSLVHGDLVQRNLLVQHDGARWTLSAVLDWEFALSGPILRDVGNVIRTAPSAFVPGLEAAMRASGQGLPDNWRELAWLLDVVSLTGPLARPDGHPDRALAKHLITKAVDLPGLPWEPG